MCHSASANLKCSPMFIRALAFLWLVTQLGLGQQPTPIVPDPKLMPGRCIRRHRSGSLCAWISQKGAQCSGGSDAGGLPRIRHHISWKRRLRSLELGGSNSIKNLWPESYRTSPWNARVKDRLENRLHELECDGDLDLKTAQREIAANWIEAYKKYVSPNPPVPKPTPPRVPATPETAGQVWVNTSSGKYWRPGSRYYGRTKQGEYMPENEAVQKRYRLANGYRRMIVGLNRKLTPCC